MTAPSLDDFLSRALSQKSASLLIVPEAGADAVLHNLEGAGYQRLPKIQSLGKAGTYFISGGEYTWNALVDLLVQYSSRQISVRDADTGEISWVNPVYAGSSLVLVMTKKEIQDGEQEGGAILSAVGLTLQL